jgi:hypothetical protein
MFLFLQQIPQLIVAACAALLVLFFFFLARMAAETRRVLRDVAEFSDILRQLLPKDPSNRRDGLQLAGLEAVRGALKSRKRLLSGNVARLWEDIEHSLEPYSGGGRPEGWFASRPLNEVLPESAVIDRVYHASFHQSVPSLLTALGLMATFVAILIALEGLTVQVRGGAEIVGGIGSLINGLAGKFLSSIIALLLAVIFTVVEKKLCERQLETAYETLLRQAAEVIPELSQARVLLDMHALSARRTALLENFYTEIVDRLVSLVKTEIVPGIAGNFGREITEQVEERLAPVLGEVRNRAAELEHIARRIDAAREYPAADAGNDVGNSEPPSMVIADEAPPPMPPAMIETAMIETAMIDPAMPAPAMPEPAMPPDDAAPPMASMEEPPLSTTPVNGVPLTTAHPDEAISPAANKPPLASDHGAEDLVRTEDI